MIDLHCHILPGIDDGASHMEESLEMARAALKQGIETVVAAPHHQTSEYYNEPQQIIEQCRKLNERLYEEGIDLTVLPGQEVRLHEEFIKELEQGMVLPINEKSGYLYVEFPENTVPHYAKQMLYDMQMAGYKPVIVHPERNRTLREQPDLLYHFVKNGAFTQLSAGSLVGRFGRDSQKFAYQIIEHNLGHVIASDAHDSKKRGFFLKEAYDKVGKKFGTDMMYQFMENAHVVLDGEMVFTNPPERIRVKKRLGLF
ncbi:tyrosine protein phosphatase [Bacillus sp. SB49]|uniref:tyrosine-protein phosphatase n=1 Tax=Bacillus sp. SB49 TaxID=1071080 RepID=UPI00041179BB|nr:CpsB/CapC family capsule biosynthesis tyrosine phosphatase [Bacillus sp. SB49]QHT47762.1 tyrosine protein phosphatase [Bacillus sp. SB49]